MSLRASCSGSSTSLPSVEWQVAYTNALSLGSARCVRAASLGSVVVEDRFWCRATRCLIRSRVKDVAASSSEISLFVAPMGSCSVQHAGPITVAYHFGRARLRGFVSSFDLDAR